MKPLPIYGIDLGTTYTKCALVRPEDGSVRAIRLDRDQPTSPQNTLEVLRSAVSVTMEEGQRIAWVGSSAWAKYLEWDPELDPPLRCFEESKLWIGENLAEARGDAPPWPFPPHGWEYRPEDIGAIVLRKVKQEVEAQGNPRLEAIVVTHPQNFSDTKREATRQAARIAELTVVETLTEPDAAAIALGKDGAPGTYMVFDLGGGTLDITIARIQRGKPLAVLTSEGIRQGGRDWDRRIFERMIDEYRDSFPSFAPDFLDDRARQDWLRKAEQIKWQLNGADEGLADPPAAQKILCKNEMFPEGMAKRFLLRRSEFEAITRALVDDCERCADQALANLSLRWSELQGVLLVGGSTRLRLVRRMLGERLGRPLNTQVDPSTVVAVGAALHAHSLALAGARRTTVGPASAPATAPAAASRPGTAAGGGAAGAGEAAQIEVGSGYEGVLRRGLGVLAWDPQSQRNVVVVLIRKDSKIPRVEERCFRTARDHETALTVELWEGDDPDPELCEPLGSCTLGGIQPGPAGQSVQVKIEICASGSKHIWVSSGGLIKEEVIRYDEQRVIRPERLEQRSAFVRSLKIR